MFGTFRNPPTFDAKTGFYDGASTRVLEMIVGKDVTVPREGEAPAVQPAVQPEEVMARVA